MIGIFDSGVGGLSVFRHIQQLLPEVDLIYLADQAHLPYGLRPAGQIEQFSEAITRFLLSQGAELIVVACNRATAAALNHLRATFPNVPFVGTEPAVKPAAQHTKSGKVGVLATIGTFESQRYASLMARFAANVVMLENPCLGLVELVEAGQLDSPETEALLRRCVDPMLAAGVDTIVLGCTHYPFIIPLLARIAGRDITIIDPAPAVARQTHFLFGNGSGRDTPPTIQTYTSGDPGRLANQIQAMLGQNLPVAQVSWQYTPTLFVAT